MSRAAFAVACVLPVMAMVIAPVASEPRHDGDGAASGGPASTNPAATVSPTTPLPAPATRELLADAPVAATSAPADASPPSTQTQPAETAYEYRPGSRDGINKWYMGRQ